MGVPYVNEIRLDTNFVDYAIIATYFVVVLGVGFAAKRYIKSSLDYFLSGRSLPAWITGLAFISANLGATEVLGMAANGAQYGVATVNYYWLGAIPAMVFLGLVMMPFYYGSKVRSVPEYLLLRFNVQSHVFNSVTFAVATILIAGVNLYALALVLKLLLGWPIIVGIIVAAVVVAAYITLGGLSSAIYNEVLQFFVILAALIPITVVGLVDVGGWGGLQDKIKESKIGEAGLHALQGTNPGDVTNPIGASWIGLVFGLGFVLAFGYWTTNFAEVQRALSAKDLSAAERTPLIGAVPKLFLPFVMILPGMIALVVIPGLGSSQPNMEYNNAIPLLMNEYLPNGMLGHRAHGPDGVVHGRCGGECERVQHRGDDGPRRAVPEEGPAGRVVRALRPHRDDRRHRRVDLHRADRVHVRQPHELPAGAVLDLQRAAVRDVHHRHVLEADDAGRRLLGPDRGHGHRRGAVHRLQGRLDQLRLGPRPVDVGRGLGLRGRRDRHRPGDAADEAQADRGAAGPRVRHGQHRRQHRPRPSMVGVAEAARVVSCSRVPPS